MRRDTFCAAPATINAFAYLMLKFSIPGSVMAVAHLAILGYTIVLIVGAGQGNWPMYWTVFLALDFPVSLAVVPLAWIFPPSPTGPLDDFANFWWPLGIHGLLGTLWWYIVGTSIGYRLSRFRTRATQNEDREQRAGNEIRGQKDARKSGRL